MSISAGSFSRLPVLRIGLDLAGEGEVVCTLEPHSSWRFSTSELGLPQYFDRRLERSGGYTFQIPPWVIDEIRYILNGDDQPLWLRLERPSGYLGAVPWERLLQPALGVPVLRLPSVESGLPRETPRALEVLLCASAPVAKDQFEVVHHLTRMVERILARVPREVRIHVFTGKEFQDALPQSWGRGSNLSGPVYLHDPQGAAGFEIPEVRERLFDPKDRLESPWLLWMRQALNGRSVDVAHFLCHGRLSSDRSALCFSESPLRNEDRRSARFVGVGELSTFLTQVGAWSTAFSSPERNFSEIGLRLLADSVGQAHPGPLVIHDLPCDPDFSALGEVYRFLYAPYPTQPPVSPALAIQCQPSRVAPPMPTRGPSSYGAAVSLGVRDAESAELDPLAEVFSSVENVPAWVAAATRYVEQQSVRLQESEAAAPTESRRSASAADTLQQMQSLLAEIASKGSGGGS